MGQIDDGGKLMNRFLSLFISFQNAHCFSIWLHDLKILFWSCNQMKKHCARFWKEIKNDKKRLVNLPPLSICPLLIIFLI